MKFKLLTRTLIICGCLVLRALAQNPDHVGVVETKTKKSKKNTKIKTNAVVEFTSDQDFIDDALLQIKKLKTDSHKGKPYKIILTYDLAGQCPVESKIKVHYSKYRQKSDLFENSYPQNAGKNIDGVVKVLYNTREKNHLTLIRKPVDRHICCSVDYPVSENLLA